MPNGLLVGVLSNKPTRQQTLKTYTSYSAISQKHLQRRDFANVIGVVAPIYMPRVYESALRLLMWERKAPDTSLEVAARTSGGRSKSNSLF